ncbi:hypothetical protein D9M69_412910 [compost metagenome]
MGGDLVQRGEDALVDGEIVEQAFAVLVDLGGQRPVPGVHRVGAPGDLDDRCVR